MIRVLFGTSRASKARFREARNIMTINPRAIVESRDPELARLLEKSLSGEYVDLRGCLKKV